MECRQHERGPGIFISEMFFFYCVVRPMNPPRILESGRDLGGSTLLLANCFPNTRIISVEFEAASPRAAIALNKLASYKNVECLFGDSRDVLPKLLKPGDPILIDGPKEFRALKLALNLLRTRRPSVVFMHDFGAGTPWRQFLDRHWPGAFSVIILNSSGGSDRSTISARHHGRRRLLVYRRTCPRLTIRF